MIGRIIDWKQGPGEGLPLYRLFCESYHNDHLHSISPVECFFKNTLQQSPYTSVVLLPPNKTAICALTGTILQLHLGEGQVGRSVS